MISVFMITFNASGGGQERSRRVTVPLDVVDNRSHMQYKISSGGVSFVFALKLGQLYNAP